ncbi:MAG: AbrB/MazE/SpoVT family DNA-binding domain-containing protein [Thermoproteota archaeon]|jgi:hypothetical protein
MKEVSAKVFRFGAYSYAISSTLLRPFIGKGLYAFMKDKEIVYSLDAPSLPVVSSPNTAFSSDVAFNQKIILLKNNSPVVIIPKLFARKLGIQIGSRVALSVDRKKFKIKKLKKYSEKSTFSS